MDVGVVGVVDFGAVAIGLVDQVRVVHFCQTPCFIDGLG